MASFSNPPFKPLAFGLALLLAGAVGGVPAGAQTGSGRLIAAASQSSTQQTGVLIGLALDGFVLKGRKGQALRVALVGKNRKLSLRVTPPGKRAVLFEGFSSLTPTTLTLPADGDYQIEVFLGQGAGLFEVAGYRLDIDVTTPETKPPVPTPGGKDMWTVQGVAPGDLLNVRSGASTREPIIARLANGTVVSNLGCVDSAGARWCQITFAPKTIGWVSAKFIVQGKPPAPKPDPIPEDGGPDYLMVKGVVAGDLLNLRSGPSTQKPIVGRLANGTVVRNAGCVVRTGARWCQISTGTLTGWASGRYLVEAPAPGSQQGAPFTGRGKLQCSTYPGQAAHSCDYQVSGDGKGGAKLSVTLDNGTVRRIVFLEGEPINSNLPNAITYRLSRGVFVIEMAGERYEVAQSIVTG